MKKVIAPVLGPLLRSARLDAGITQTELADIVEVKQSTVSMWESGRQRPHLHQVPLIAETLGIDATSLVSAVTVETLGCKESE